MVTGLSQWGLLAVLAGAVCGAGTLLLAVAIRGLPAGPGPGAAARRLLRELAGLRGAAAVAAGAVALVATRWLVAGAGVALLVFAWRGLSGAAGERRALARLEALATWTESLRDTIAGAIGLEQAIPATAATAGSAIRPSLNLLVDRLRIREPLPVALLAFADDLDDPSADVVCASLILNSRLRGPGLRDVLGALAVSIREELDMRRRIEASRKSIRRSVKIVLTIVLGVMGLLSVFNKQYVAPYDSLGGQVALIVVAVLFLGGLLWLRKLATPAKIDRFLVS